MSNFPQAAPTFPNLSGPRDICLCGDPDCPVPMRAVASADPAEAGPADCNGDPCTCGQDPAIYGGEKDDFDPRAEREIEGLTHVEAVDALNDVLEGIVVWKETKLVRAPEEWGRIDEFLARWVEAGPNAVSDRLD